MCKNKRKMRTIINAATKGADSVFVVYENRDRRDLTTVIRIINTTALIYDVKQNGYVVPQRRVKGWVKYPGHGKVKQMTGVAACAWIEPVKQ